MIIEYHRPDSLSSALDLLTRTGVPTVPLGGGTVLNQPSPDPIAVVDLQALGLNSIQEKGKELELGSMVTLQQLQDVSGLPYGLHQAVRHEATYNIRQIGTIAGTVVAANGRSPLTTALLALGVVLTIQPGDETIGLGDFLPLRSAKRYGHLITRFTLPMNVMLTYQYVARTQADLPIVCVAVAKWPSGRTRVALGGFGSAPLLAMDGSEPAGAEAAARDAYREAGDQWASAEYRSDVAATLVQRCLE